MGLYATKNPPYPRTVPKAQWRVADPSAGIEQNLREPCRSRHS